MTLNKVHKLDKVSDRQKQAFSAYAKNHGYYFETVKYNLSLRLAAMAEYKQVNLWPSTT